jgi:hypothetical protein
MIENPFFFLTITSCQFYRTRYARAPSIERSNKETSKNRGQITILPRKSLTQAPISTPLIEQEHGSAR